MAWLLRLCGLLRGRSGKAIALALCAAQSLAWAADQCTEYRASDDLTSLEGEWAKSPEDAITSMTAKLPRTAYVGSCLGTVSYTPLSVSAASFSYRATTTGCANAPPPSTYNGRLLTREATDCGDTCKGNDGRTQVVNFTVGWARSGEPDAEDHVGKIVFPRGSVCVNNCTWQVTDNGVAAYRSVVPSPQGLHRLSVDFTLLGDGSVTCKASSDADKAADPNQPPKQCPGYVGEVNGKTVCVGSAAKPVGSPEGLSAGRQAGAGEDTGNPSAGKKPSSGEGSGTGGAGRTPQVGEGSNPGGPAGAVGGGKPNGTTTKPGDGKEQAACGAPGQAKCKIDETGTPDGKGAFDGPTKSLDEAFGTAKKQLDGVNAAGDKDTGWGVVPSWLQHSACVPWSLGTLPVGDGREITIDVCRIMPYVETVTSFLWAITTFVATLAMVFRVTTASKGS